MNQLVFLLLQSSVDWCLNFSLPFVTIKFKFLRLHLFFKYTKNKLVLIEFFLNFFWRAPFGYLYYLSFQSFNEPGLGAWIDPGMALTPFPSSIGWDLNPQPSNCESSLLSTRPDFRPTCPNCIRSNSQE